MQGKKSFYHLINCPKHGQKQTAWINKEGNRIIATCIKCKFENKRL